MPVRRKTLKAGLVFSAAAGIAMNGLSAAVFVPFVFAANYGQVIKTSNADIEFIGLRTWTAQDLYEKIVASNPDKPFHACAVYLKDVLNFAEAAVTHDLSQGRLYTIITVVEPQFASRIRYNSPPADTKGPIARWSALSGIYELHPNEYSLAIQLAGYHFGTKDYDLSKAGFPLDEETISEIENVWHTLEALGLPEDYALALETLENDANVFNRIAAISVLANFLDRDTSWQAMMKSFCDRDARIFSAATALLRGFARVRKRPVDWSPITPTLRALLDGTNLFAFVPTLEILTATEISPKLDSPLLKEGGELLLDYLKANRQTEKDLARNFLAQLSGRDFGFDANRWSSWIGSLK